MKFLVVGQTGQVARALAQTWRQELGSVEFADRQKIDFERPQAIASYIDANRPDFVINSAAYTAVDLAESNFETAVQVNARGPQELARACARSEIPIVHFSTDYVYSGSGCEPWSETAPIAPLSAYGRTKAQGDEAVASANSRHLILRTAWVYSSDGKNFLRTMLKLGAEREALRVVDDQVGSPTWASDIARMTMQVAEAALRPGFNAWGVYHVVASGTTSWRGFAEAIFEEARARGFPLKVSQVQAILTSEYPTPARRPLNSRLSTEKLERVFGIKPPSWRDSLRECVAELARKEWL